MFARRRPLLRAAVVGGGAYVAGKHMARASDQRAADEAYQDDRISALEQQQQQGGYQQQGSQQQGSQQQGYQDPQQGYGAPPPQAAPAAGPSITDQLQQIATLHQQGALSDEEFAAAKAKLLGT